MTKNELIEELQSIEGNPKILLCDTELGCIMLRCVKLQGMHQSNDDIGEYVTDFEFKGEIGRNTFYHDNYRERVEECVLLH